MRLVVAALVALFLFVPAAQAQVTFKDVSASTVAPPAPTIDAATVGGSTATLNGTTAAGTTVAVFEGTRKLGDATVTDTSWTFAAANLRDGTHSLTAVAHDAADNASPASAPRD